MNPGILSAIAAAVLFGASTPLAKLLVEQLDPVLLAGILYLGAGLGLCAWLVLRRLSGRDALAAEAPLRGADLPTLGFAILAGGVLGPVLLMVGLTHTSAASASLLLNLEGVFTALLAWFVFAENFDRRILLGMGLIVAAGIMFCWPAPHAAGMSWGALAVVGACLAWAVDNNLTRRISASDPVQIAGLKGLIAGCVNLGAALMLGVKLPAPQAAGGAALVGLGGYGLSLVLYILALRRIGTARTGAYFSLAPFIGAAIALLLFSDDLPLLFWPAAALMAAGVYLHLSEQHSHLHEHEALAHSHRHVHDEHHQHAHDFPWDGSEPHTHWHVHAHLVHTHPHYPDIHHRHRHK